MSRIEQKHKLSIEQEVDNYYISFGMQHKRLKNCVSIRNKMVKLKEDVITFPWMLGKTMTKEVERIETPLRSFENVERLPSDKSRNNVF